MFNSTHTLVGVAMARAGLDRWAPYASWTAVIAANLPDIDILALAWGTPAYIDHHRGFTHALIGVPILSLLLAGAMYGISKNFWGTFYVALLALASHPLLDFANNYGVRPLLPLDGTWYYGDALFIIDPLLDSILLVLLVSSALIKRHRRVLAAGALAMSLIYVAARIELRDMARIRLEQFTSGVTGVQRTAVLPQMLDPFGWIGIIETDKEVYSVDVNAFAGVGSVLARMSREEPSAVSERAGTTRTAEVFRGFARFPVVRVERPGSTYRVLMADFRFYQAAEGTVFGAEIMLDKSLRVIDEDMGFTISAK